MTRPGSGGDEGSGQTVGSLLTEIGGALSEAGLDEPHRLARRLVAMATGFSQSEVFAYPERRLSEVEITRVRDALSRVLAHEPLTRMAGEREFWGLSFCLSPDTLDPRPETETLVEAVLARCPDRARAYRFLDLGTGTGCLLLVLLSEYPNATGVGIDVALGAAGTARSNARALGLADRASFVVGDWAAPLEARFDVTVANPPYIERAVLPNLPPEVRLYDPARTLDGGLDGLAAYRAIAADLPRLLLPGGLFAAEIGAGQGEAVAAILSASGLAVETVLPDLAGIPRCVIARAD